MVSFNLMQSTATQLILFEVREIRIRAGRVGIMSAIPCRMAALRP
jgi:hypothetical protein